MENDDPKDSFYRDELEDIGAGDYPLEDPMTFWNAEKKAFWKKIMGRSETPFILMGLLLVIVVIVFFTVYPGGGGQEVSSEDAGLADRVRQMEETLGDMQARVEQISQIQHELEFVKTTVAGIDRPDATLSTQVEQITGELASLKKEMAKVKESVSAVKESASVAVKEPVVTVKDEKKEADTQSVYYEVKKGDTLYSIGRRYGVSVAAIRERNGLSEKDAIQPGQKLRIK